MSSFNLSFAASTGEFLHEMQADFEEWYYALSDWQQEDTAASIEACNIGDYVFLAGHKCYLTQYTEHGTPVFQPMEH